MLKNFKRPHGIILILILAFVVAWFVWTAFLVPRAADPIQPATPMNPTGQTAPPAH